LIEEYDVEAEQCQQELLALLKDLHDAEMIVAVG
jgi:hypothetical protein